MAKTGNYKLALGARTAATLEAVAAECGGPDVAIAVPTDATKREDVKALLAAAYDKFGRIDIVINNAGKGCSAFTSVATDDVVDEMMSINVKSALYGMQEALPYFAKNEGECKGHIVNVGSLAGRVAYSYPEYLDTGVYCASKYFLGAITDVFRGEMKHKKTGVKVTLYLPGLVATDFGVNAGLAVDNNTAPGAQDVQEVAANIIEEVLVKQREDVYSREAYKEWAEGYLKERHAQ